MDDLRLEGKVVLITGGSSGLGQNAAVAFAMQGAYLSLTGRSEDGLAMSKRKCIDAGLPADKIFTIAGDITNMDDCKQISDETAKYFGKIDVLVNNAGVVATGEFEKTPVEKVKSVFETNVKGTFHMTKTTLPWLLATKGNIVNVSSFTAQRPVNDYFAYCLSKSALDQMTKNLALELGPVGIRVNVVNPGIMRDTNLWSRPGMPLYKMPIFGGFILKKIGPMYPLGRGSLSDEVVPAILFLSSDTCSSFITGHSLMIDGGKALTSEQAF
ncbi:hypothetical protein CAPTEDRAFT_218914 [Capitella teleta]|uniref:Ketoreductase domain-containing protein n=1 Tax=Capitella teleta TaxID=283909 RepID=R7TQT1_CAPTE|nr:hypothetical protein CAPTEDRAFT_218914 [Capitella teleta]|eukprot:ELT96278.1 hypothetical protein CAPTEDRAFT_218914 [Capitella teleta]